MQNTTLDPNMNFWLCRYDELKDKEHRVTDEWNNKTSVDYIYANQTQCDRHNATVM